MTAKIFCPVDGSLMEHAGDHGIVDYDGNWDAQASKYECAEGKHIIFVVDAERVLEPGDEALAAAEWAIVESLECALWETEEEARASGSAMSNSSVVLPRGTDFGPKIISLEDLRSELAQRALTAFKTEVAESPEEYEDIEYEYIHAMEDVDLVLAEEEYQNRLKGLGWLGKI